MATYISKILGALFLLAAAAILGFVVFALLKSIYPDATISIWAVYPALALMLGILLSIYLFAVWLRHPSRRPKFLLFWALALFLMYWFQVPVILTNLGRQATITNFNLFFAITFPITFLALSLIYLGALDVLNLKMRPNSKRLFFLWFLSAIAFFAYQFIVQQGVIQTYTLPLVGNLAFYVPIRILIILTLIGWIRRGGGSIYGLFGAAGIIGESILGLTRNFLIVKNVLAYPPEFWYVALTNLKIFFILQSTSIILLAIGFFFFHQEYHCKETSH